ncbi:Transcription termination factor nusG domain protein [Luminiphilus syltensis NOR5-1B]|uniref:Transcription termination factor nusG domain protein n=1 Tax=Luminiphilus syltensis NOR5-1B TaxID=565045 RepID=B8KUX9_9GAMM|nr:transcriptional activator RfaH [Luminiphilus syltensis]EED36519.1 Transcription termination factor nusG domain protein [Luminiphilus syltensis NOR5-1B]
MGTDPAQEKSAINDGIAAAPRRWYVVASKPRSEGVAKSQLERQGFVTCAPRIKLRKRQRGKWQQVIEPLFPGYLFVALRLGVDDPAPIRSTLGCIGLVRMGREFVPVPEAVMQPLLSIGESPDASEAVFQPGQAVRFEAGPFEGLSGIFKMPKGQDRAEVLITLLGSSARWWFPARISTLRPSPHIAPVRWPVGSAGFCNRVTVNPLLGALCHQ